MGIPIKLLEEDCCDNKLRDFNVYHKFDKLDDNGSTCDKVIECHDKYYLIEEKSILLSFFANLCKEKKVSFGKYIYVKHKIKYIKINELFEFSKSIDDTIKRMIIAESMNKLILDSGKKASNTTNILNKDFDNKKTADMPVIYLYCKSGHAVDRLLNGLLSRYANIAFMECQKLKEKLEKECL